MDLSKLSFDCYPKGILKCMDDVVTRTQAKGGME
jgi:hypothetical protein